MSDRPPNDPIISAMSANADLIEIIEGFVAELPKRVAELTFAFESENFDELWRLAHQLKASAGDYGFPTITDAASELEQVAGRSNGSHPVDAIKREIEALGELCCRARSK
jgi:HPt (histidine-containing phosphotransfer) domain-containing protein